MRDRSEVIKGLLKYLGAVLISHTSSYSAHTKGCIVKGVLVESERRSWVLVEPHSGGQVPGYYQQYIDDYNSYLSYGELDGRLKSFPMAHGGYRPLFYFLGCPLREKFLKERAA